MNTMDIDTKNDHITFLKRMGMLETFKILADIDSLYKREWIWSEYNIEWCTHNNWV